MKNTHLFQSDIWHNLFPIRRKKQVVCGNPCKYKIYSKSKRKSNKLCQILHTSLWEGVDEHRFRVYLCPHTGLRLGEMCALKWLNIDFDLARINVHHMIVLVRNPSGDNSAKAKLPLSSSKSLTRNRFRTFSLTPNRRCSSDSLSRRFPRDTSCFPPSPVPFSVPSASYALPSDICIPRPVRNQAIVVRSGIRSSPRSHMKSARYRHASSIFRSQRPGNADCIRFLRGFPLRSVSSKNSGVRQSYSANSGVKAEDVTLKDAGF